MPNYSLYQVYQNKTEHLGKKTILGHFKESPLLFEPNIHRYINTHIYEFTVTFDPRYWSLQQITSYGVVRVIETIFRKLHRTQIEFTLDYVIEYHENGRQHIHGQIMAESSLPTEIQKQLHGMLTGNFGRSQWYQTGNEDKFHEKPEMKWSDYIRKDLIKNNDGNLLHGYSIQRTF